MQPVHSTGKYVNLTVAASRATKEKEEKDASYIVEM